MKQIKYFLYLWLFLGSFVSAEAQFKSFDQRYTLEQIPSSEYPSRSIIVLKFNDIIIDSIFGTYNSIGRKWKGFESYYIASETEVAFINQGVYSLMKLNENNEWRSADFFQLMYCRWIDGVMRPGVRYCCTKWKLEGLQEIFRSEKDDCNQEPEWVRMDFNKERQQVQHMRGGTPENKKWIEEIKEKIIQDSIKNSKN